MKIDARFSLERDSECWILSERLQTKSKKGGPGKEKTRLTYHANMTQALKEYADRAGKGCRDLSDLDAALRACARAIESLASSEIAV